MTAVRECWNVVLTEAQAFVDKRTHPEDFTLASVGFVHSTQPLLRELKDHGFCALLEQQSEGINLSIDAKLPRSEWTKVKRLLMLGGKRSKNQAFFSAQKGTRWHHSHRA
eukprot:8405808-Pyramimonas_sp.AAC.1